MSEEGFGLQVPFVVCASQGGPFDDDAYVAGYEAGQIELFLEHRWADVLTGFPAHAANVPLLDLLAMRHGYTMIAEPWEDDPTWVFLAFTPVGP